MEASTRTMLVCPNCGNSDRLATREQAEIWQPARFYAARNEPDAVLEDVEGYGVDVAWDAYSSEDVGDTETIGYACRDCTWTWPDEATLDGAGPVPFITRDEYEKRRLEGMTIEGANELLEARRDALTDGGYNARRAALDQAMKYGADDPEYGRQQIRFAIEGL
jgi:hypothetical protein